MATIQIKKDDLIDTLESALKHAGSTDWDIYANISGELSIRHSTYDNQDWYEVIGLYNADLENGGKYPNDDGYDYRGSAEWIVNEVGGWLPEYGEIEHKIELID